MSENAKRRVRARAKRVRIGDIAPPLVYVCIGMDRAPSIAEFLADPIGKYWAGRRHAVFSHSPKVFGIMTWGHPDRADIEELLQASAVSLAPERVPHVSLADLRDLEGIDPSTFGPFVDYTRKHQEALKRNILRNAQIHSGGFVGAVLSGFTLMSKFAYPVRAFREAGEALDWLDIDRTAGLALLNELQRIRTDSRGAHAIVERLRSELDASGALPIGEAARRFGQSTRTFQRALQEAGTTYRGELHGFRIRRATALLRGDRPISWIAAEVGFATAPHFSTAFRQATGETPTEWRARNNGKGAVVQ